MSNEKLTELLLTENLPDILKRAESGDVLAAKEALIHISLSLGDTKHPLPDYMREYLAKCLYRMAAGDDANRAMHLKKSGPKKWGHFEKRLAAELVYRLIENGLPVDYATFDAEEIIQEAANSMNAPAWAVFKGKTLNSDMLRNWYFELKEEISQIHNRS